jgi:hypothetical protein
MIRSVYNVHVMRYESLKYSARNQIHICHISEVIGNVINILIIFIDGAIRKRSGEKNL